MSLFKKDEDRKSIYPCCAQLTLDQSRKKRLAHQAKVAVNLLNPNTMSTQRAGTMRLPSSTPRAGSTTWEVHYGYVDTQTGIEVLIDMINGGGANAAGDTFVSPFAGTPMGWPAQAYRWTDHWRCHRLIVHATLCQWKRRVLMRRASPCRSI